MIVINIIFLIFSSIAKIFSLEDTNPRRRNKANRYTYKQHKG